MFDGAGDYAWPGDASKSQASKPAMTTITLSSTISLLVGVVTMFFHPRCPAAIDGSSSENTILAS